MGVPGGGAITNAASLALYYQALLRDARVAAPGSASPPGEPV